LDAIKHCRIHQTKTDKINTVGNKKIRVAIFASGAGSNAKKIIERFSKHQNIEVALVVCNKPSAGVVDIAAANSIPSLLIEREKFFRGDAYIPELTNYNIQFIVLAGFLWKIPSALIKTFPDKIINIHPALLPKYGGKGMFGGFVHEAVIAAKEKESGITIHVVDELYDHGDHIFQAKCPVYPGDSPEELAHRIHELEHQHFPRVIEEVILKKIEYNK
jgi:phosphoribosylglycinamide formyltransferase 1